MTTPPMEREGVIDRLKRNAENAREFGTARLSHHDLVVLVGYIEELEARALPRGGEDEDARRLDWLEARREIVTISSGKVASWWVRGPTTPDGRTSLRDAIDDALAQESARRAVTPTGRTDG